MAKSQRKNVPDAGMEPGTARMPGGQASDRATAPGQIEGRNAYITDNGVVREKGNYLLQVLKTFAQ